MVQEFVLYATYTKYSPLRSPLILTILSSYSNVCPQAAKSPDVWNH